MNTLNGYSKSTLTDNYVLTAAGGHFPLDNTSGEALGSNTYINTLATNKSIIVEGNADTYYPVRIYMPKTKLDSTRISIWKNLGSQTASYTGNHNAGTSSLWLIYEGRNNYYDGNGGFIKTWYKSEPYAKLVAHANQMGSGCGDLIVWLRGGGTQYNISCSIYCDVVVYLEETNLTYGSTVLTLDLKTAVENGGIISSFLGYGYVEQADKLKTIRTIWGNNFNGTNNVEAVPNFKTSVGVSEITIDTVAIKLGTKSTTRNGYNSGISFNGLFGYSNSYFTHIHAWIGLQGYVNGNSAETYNLVFAVNNSTTVNSSPTEYMRITPDGKVGIGTTTITEKLEVNGNIKATSFKGNLDWSYIQNKPISLPAAGGTADKLGSTTMGSTTQPIYLNNGTPTLCTSYTGLLTALTNNGNQIALTVGGTTKNLTVNYANYAGVSDNALLFQDMSTLPVAGDSRPWEKIVMVDINGVSHIGTELRFNYDNDSDAGGTTLICTGQYQNTIQLPDRDGTIALIEDLANLGDGTASGYWANVPISSSASNVTTPIFKTVNIGITTSSHVTNGRATLSLVTTSANPCDFWIGADNTPYWSITVRNSADSANSKGFNIYDNIAKKYRLRIFTNGNVQIGESSSQKGNLTVNGSVNALDGFFETSDAYLKNFLNDITIDFEKLSKLPKMYFTWKFDEKEMPDLQIGTSAQELQKIYPELVGEVDGHLTVAYDKLSIIALKAIDELYTMNVELKKQNAKLKSKVDRLERRVYYGKKY